MKVGLLLLAVGLLAADEATFEVASIKASSPDAIPMVIGLGLRHGRLTGTRVTPRAMLSAAYGLTEPRVFGPDFLDEDHFDVLAKSPDGVPDSEMKPMLQFLLRDRFQLTAHRETREMPVYDLVVAKGGPKMPVHPAVESKAPPHAPGFPMMRATATMSRFAEQLSRAAGRPVFDKTGLTERYNIALTYAPLVPRSGDVPEFAPPDLFTALQQQLGLKLEPKREGIEVIVVDHINRTPSAN